MPVKIDSISIHNFRSFRNFNAEGLGGVTLITGKNNSGKSTLLEAIRLLALDGAPSVFGSILNYREAANARQEETASTISPEEYSSFCSLFTGYPTLAECNEPFSIDATRPDGNPYLHLTTKISWFEEKIDEKDGSRSLVPSSNDLFGESVGFPTIEIETLKRTRLIRIDRPFNRRPFNDPPEGSSLPCIYLDPFSSRSTAHLATLWDSIALTSSENDVVEALQIVAPEIIAVNMVGGTPPLVSRIAIARTSSFSHPVPLRNFGDGVNRLFGLMLSLCCAKGGILLVDEIENGLHYSILPKLWKMIFELARRLDVQIFATTHSFDCVNAFQMEAENNPEEGILLKVATKGDKIFSRVFREKELAIASRDEIELR